MLAKFDIGTTTESSVTDQQGFPVTLLATLVRDMVWHRVVQ
jgi:hypothetical protein